MKKRISTFFVLLIITLSAATSGAQAVPASCTPPPECTKPTKNNFFCIDASSNGPPSQSASYGHRSVVGVWLINKNPWLFDYKVSTTQKDFSKEDSDAISAFGTEVGIKLGGASTPPAPTTTPNSANPSQAQGIQPQVQFVQPTSSCKSSIDSFESFRVATENVLKAVQQEEKQIADYLDTGTKRITEARLSSRSGEEACKAAAAVQDYLANFFTAPISNGGGQGKSLGDAADLLASDLVVLKNKMGSYEDYLNRLPCRSASECLDPRFKKAFMALTECTEAEYPAALAAVEGHLQYVQQLKPLVAKTQKDAAKISTSSCKIDAARSQIASVLGDGRAFVERIGPFGPYSDSEDVNIRVSADSKKTAACDAAAEDASAAASPKPPGPPVKGGPSSSTPPATPSVIIADVTLHFGGGQRVYAAAGTTVSFLSVKEFQRATGFTSGTTSGTIIDFKTDSSTRISPLMGFLHWRPLDNEHLFLSFGATAKSDNQSTSAEFLFGPSLGFLGNRIFFTGGAYVGQQQKLAGNLHIGDTVPSSLTGEIPVQKSYHWSGGFSINFRISGGGGSSPTTQPKTPKKAAGSGSQ